MKMILDVGCGNGSWAFALALKEPGNVYVNLDKDDACYKIDSPKRAYRFLVGEIVLRAQEKLGLDIYDEKTGGAIFYLGQDFQIDGGLCDKAALKILEEYKDGKDLLGMKIMLLEDVGINKKSIRKLLKLNLKGKMPRKLKGILKERMSNLYHVVGDLNQLPFKGNSFDYVGSSGTLNEYESSAALEEAQRVLRSGKIKRSADGIETEV